MLTLMKAENHVPNGIKPNQTKLKTMNSKSYTNCNSKHRSGCPITCTLELVGDKWSLLLIRDIIFGKHRYADFERSSEHIPTNILADRLKRLIAHEVLEKVSYQERPVRYAYKLTAKGADLIDVLQTIAKWGMKHNTGELNPPDIFWNLTSDQILKNQQTSIQALMSAESTNSDA